MDYYSVPLKDMVTNEQNQANLKRQYENQQLEKANENIRQLVIEIIEMRKDSEIKYCCNADIRSDGSCSGSCEICKDKYYKDLYNFLLKNYIVE